MKCIAARRENSQIRSLELKAKSIEQNGNHLLDHMQLSLVFNQGQPSLPLGFDYWNNQT